MLKIKLLNKRLRQRLKKSKMQLIKLLMKRKKRKNLKKPIFKSKKKKLRLKLSPRKKQMNKTMLISWLK
jgi:hypothetical protein